jgi:hypothetical protein
VPALVLPDPGNDFRAARVNLLRLLRQVRGAGGRGWHPAGRGSEGGVCARAGGTHVLAVGSLLKQGVHQLSSVLCFCVCLHLPVHARGGCHGFLCWRGTVALVLCH